jgi:N-acetylglutamate synthase-like GNAT family acetyltransferase
MSNIRAARASDYHSINRLSQLFGYPQESGDLASARLNELLNSDSDKVWVFEQQNQVLGWIHLFIAKRLASATFVEIGGLVVSADFRRQGIGRQLVERANGWAREKHLSLRVRCNAKRDDSCAFYRAVNFSELKSQLVFEADPCRS